MFGSAMCIRVLKMSDDVLPEHDVRAEILNTASIKNLDALTICGRLWSPFRPHMTNVLQDIIQIKNLWFLFRYDMRSCERRYPGCTQFYKETLIPGGWTTGNAVGVIYYNATYVTFPLWKPNVWNAFCITLDASNKIYRTLLNGQEVFRTAEYQGDHQHNDRDIVLMNSLSSTSGSYANYFITPFNGQISDINIWSRVLNDKEIENWSKCTSNQDSGMYLGWSNAKINHTQQIKVLDVDKAKVCKEPKSSRFIAFHDQLAFEDTVKFCKNLGGEIAVAKDTKSIGYMKEAFKNLKDNKVSDCSEVLYSGFWKKNGHFESRVSGERMNWTTTIQNSNISPFGECALLDLEKEIFLQERGSIEKCPICYFPDWPEEFQLRGVSIEEAEEIDSSYYLLNSTHLIGKTKSKIIHDGHYWNISNMKGEVIFSKQLEKFPLGINEWHSNRNISNHNNNFNNGLNRRMNHNHANTPHAISRTLNLHRFVDQPGNFCCDDGTCITSGKIINSKYIYYNTEI